MMWVDGQFNVTERTPRGVLRCSQNRTDLLPRTSSAMIGKMFRTTIGVAALLAAFFLVGCGTSSTAPEGGSLQQADTGVSSSGYPAGANRKMPVRAGARQFNRSVALFPRPDGKGRSLHQINTSPARFGRLAFAPNRGRPRSTVFCRRMGSAAALSVEEYLHTSFPDLDREYRDGETVERTLPDYLHGKAQGLLAAFFLTLEEQLSLHPCVETRMRVRQNRYLIPDVVVFHPDEPKAIPETPPLVTIEVLSPDDKMGEVREKLEEYRMWGVPHVGLVDPRSLRFYTGDKGLTDVSALVVPELGIEITKHSLFKSFK